MPDHRSRDRRAIGNRGVRALIRALLLSVALAACAMPSARCDVSVTRDLSFSGADAEETVIARALGPSCDKAIGVYEIRAKDGRPIWAWASPLAHSFGDVFDPGRREEMRDFLERWAQPQLATTQTAPGWRALQPGQTTLDRLTYEDIRARDLPMLCHASGTGRETCIFFEPVAGGAGHFFDRDMEGV